MDLRRASANIVLLCIGTVFALAISEMLARLLHPLSTVEYRVDIDVGHILVPNQHTRWVSQDYDVVILTNSAGFHDVEHSVKKLDGVYRIVVLGDSCIEALQLPIEEGFAQQLEQLLGQRVTGKRVEVINLAISGTGPVQYYRMLEIKGLQYQPDMVVMVVLPDNDFRDSSQSLSGSVSKPYYTINSDGALSYVPTQESGLGVSLRPWLRRSAFLHLVRLAIATTPVEAWLAQIGLFSPAGGVRSDDSYSGIPLDWHVYLADLPKAWRDAYQITLRMIREAKQLAEQHNAQFLVVLIGSPPTIENRWKAVLASYPGASQVSWDFERPYRAIEVLGQEIGFEVVNLVEPFRRDYEQYRVSQAWPHDGHWNRRGHQLAAEVVSDFLVKNGDKFDLK